MGSKERQQFDRAIKITESSAVAREVRFRTVDRSGTRESIAVSLLLLFG